MGAHTWKVRGKNSSGVGPWSTTRSFTIVNVPSTAPTLSEPANGATVQANVSTQFSWGSVSGATGYDLQFDSDTPIDRGSSTSFSLNSSTVGAHTWKVRGKNSSGVGPWSTTRSFTISRLENNRPQLSNGYVTPTNGTTSTVFTYYVTYHDDDGNNPNLIQANIDGSGGNYSHDMLYVSGSVATGAVFQYSTILTNTTHSFYFSCSDNQGNSDQTSPISGPTIHNFALGDTKLSNGYVTPSEGNTETNFSFYVTYSDNQGRMPDPLLLYIIGPNGSNFYKMTFVSGSNKSGALYTYTTKLPTGSYRYYYYSSTENGQNIQTEFVSGPQVSIIKPKLGNGYITPWIGKGTDVFNYFVTYSHPNGLAPDKVLVMIDKFDISSGYEMKFVEGSFTTGAIYKYATKLDIGSHFYGFYCCNQNNTSDQIINLKGPVVDGPHQKPELTNGYVTPTKGTTNTIFEYYVKYKNLENQMPTQIIVYIDKVNAFPMSLVKGSAKEGAIFKYQTKLAKQPHQFFFYCKAAGSDVVTTEPVIEPFIVEEEKSDLYAIDDEFSIVKDGSDYAINCIVRNKGPEINSYSVQIREERAIDHVSTLVWDGSFEIPLKTNDSQKYAFPFHPSSYKSIIHMYLDPLNKIDESDENNNHVQTTIFLAAPQIITVEAKYDGNKDKNIFGNYVSGLKNTINTFTAKTAGDVQKVTFKINDKTFTDINPADGWTFNYDMGSLNQGEHELTAIAFGANGIPSNLCSKVIKVVDIPFWIKGSIGNVWDVENISIDGGYINFDLLLKEKSPFEYLLFVNNDIKFIPLGSFEAKSEMLLSIGFPLDPTLGLKGELILKLNQTILGFNAKEDEFRAGLRFNADGSLNSFILRFEKQALLVGMEVKQSFPITTGLKGVIGGGFDVFGKLNVRLVGTIENNKFKFVKTPEGESTFMGPGIGLQFNLIAGLELIFGTLSAELVLSPRFDIDVGVSYLDPPYGSGLSVTASGEAEIFWKVIGSVFRGAWEKELFSGSFGPWQVFESRMLKSSNISRISYKESVQLPSSLPFPKIAADNRGNVMIVWLDNSLDNTSPPQIMYSLKEKANPFSKPICAICSQFYKSDPTILMSSSGKTYLTYTQNSKDRSFSSNNLSEILRFQDIYYTTFDNLSWSEPVLISKEILGQERSDGVPSLAESKNDVNKLIVWTRNKEINSLDRKGLEIYYVTINSNNISLPKPITNNNESDLMVRTCFFNNDDALAIWINDKDSDSQTADDSEIKYSIYKNSIWSTTKNLTQNALQEKDVTLDCFKNGIVVAAWVQIETVNNVLKYSLLSALFNPISNTWEKPELICQSDHFIESPIIRVSGEIATIIWRGYYKNINGDILFSSKSCQTGSPSWQNPRALTDDNQIDWMISTTIDAENNQYYVYSKSNLASDNSNFRNNFQKNISLSSINLLDHSAGGIDPVEFGAIPLGPDLLIDSTSFYIEPDSKPCEKVRIFFALKNSGTEITTKTRLQIFNNDPHSDGIPIHADINIPEIKADSIYQVQATINRSAIDSLYIIIDPDGYVNETDRSNNIYVYHANLLPDLQPFNIEIPFPNVPKINDHCNISYTATNFGFVDVKNIRIKLLWSRKDSIQTAILLHDTFIPELKQNTPLKLSTPFTITYTGTNYLWLIIDPENKITESNESNNICKTIFKVLPDLKVDTLWYDFSSETIRTVVSNIGGVNINSYIAQITLNDLTNKLTRDTLTTKALNIGQKETLIYRFPLNGGAYNILLNVNSNFEEFDYKNNTKVISLGSQGITNLKSEIRINENTNWVSKDYILLIASIENTGTIGLSSIEYYVDGLGSTPNDRIRIKSGVIPFLDSGQTFQDTLKIIQIGKPSAILLNIDSQNLIVENDEADNKISVDISKLTFIHDYHNNVTQFELFQNYPNPFNSETEIKYSVAYLSHVKIELFDILGRNVDTLVDEGKQKGTYVLYYKNDRISSGIYFLRMITDRNSYIRKMVMVR